MGNPSLDLKIVTKLNDKNNDEGGCDCDCEVNEVRIIAVFLKKVLNFVVQYKYEGTTSTTKNVRECTFEECFTTF